VGARRELFDVMVQIARTGRGPSDPIASIGCSIKWPRSWMRGATDNTRRPSALADPN